MKGSGLDGLLFEKVSKAFGGRRIISHLSCELPAGVHWLEADNGVGKTTLLEMAVGLTCPTWGVVSWKGRQVRVATREGMARVAYCPSKPSYYDGSRVEDAVRLYQMLHRLPVSGDMFSDFDPFDLHRVRNVVFGELSFGWKRRALLHMTFSIQPSILALDEPFVGLDGNGCDVLHELLAARQAEGITLVTGHGMNGINRNGFSSHRLLTSEDGLSRQTMLIPM